MTTTTTTSMLSSPPPLGGSGGGGGGVAGTQHAAAGTSSSGAMDLNGGRFDFDDGGTYCGGWEDGKAHGHGVCTGPKGQGEYAGSWHYGFEVSGVYTWPSGSTYEGHWQNGKRHGLGVESRGRWLYRGEWTQGFKGRYGVRQSTVSMARYEGTWANGLQDGYGSETYADGGTYQGQWLRGMRHGYGARSSAPFGLASHLPSGAKDEEVPESGGTGPSKENGKGLVKRGSETSLNAKEESSTLKRGVDTEARGGFVLRSRSDEVPHRRRSLVERSGMKSFVQGLKLKKQRSTGDIDRKGVTSIRSTGSTTSWMSSESGYTAGGASVISEGSNQSFILEDEQLDASVTETYMGEWKNDKRTGFGVSERSDGLKYEGEWYNNRKYGYGVTTFRDGSKEEGKYKNNILITSNQKRHLFLIRSAKFRERIESALNAANRASKIALQKADIAISRTATARGKAEQADIAGIQAREDGNSAVKCAQQYQQDIDFVTPAPNPNQLRPEPFFKDKSHSPVPHLMGNAIVPPSPTARDPVYPGNPPSAGETGVGGILKSPGLGPNPGLMTTAPEIATFPNAQKRVQPSNQRSHNNNNNNISTSLNPISSSTFQTSSAEPFSSNAAQENFRTKSYSSVQTDHHHHFRLQDPPTDKRFSSQQVDRKQNVPPSASPITLNSSSAVGGAINCDINVEPTFPLSSSSLSRPSQTNQHRSSSYSVRPSSSTTNRLSSNLEQSSRFIEQQHKESIFGGANEQHHGDFVGGQQSFQRIMDDHLEHYRKPPSRPPSREASIDRLPISLSEAPMEPALGGSRPSSRPPSRNRAPMLQRSPNLTSVDDSKLQFLRHGATVNGGEYSRDSSAVRYRGGHGQGQGLQGSHVQPSQEIQSLGTIPKRTESLYMKYADQEDQIGSAPLQRKKSLPDVQNLVGVTKSAGSKEMTREEISVLSSSRRDNVRRQMEETERYKANPLLYIFNPRIQDWISRQQLMLVVLFVNLSLAFMFFKLLT